MFKIFKPSLFLMRPVLISSGERTVRTPELKNVTNRTQIKAERKAQIEADLNELMIGDLYLTEANRAIFKSILSFYSRDSYYAFKELM
jgi:hypothetical protein